MAHTRTEQQIDAYNRFGSPRQWLAAAAIGLGSAGTTFRTLVRAKFHADSEFRAGFGTLNNIKNEKLLKLANDQITETVGHLQQLNEFKSEKSFQIFVEKRSALNNLYDMPGGIDSVAREELLAARTQYQESVEIFFRECKDKIDAAQHTDYFKKLARNFGHESSNIKVKADALSNVYAETFLGLRSVGLRGQISGVWQRFRGFGNYSKTDILFKTAAALAVGFGGTMMVFNQLNTRDKLNEIDKQTERSDRKLDELLEQRAVHSPLNDSIPEHQPRRAIAGHVQKLRSKRSEQAELAESSEMAR